MKCHYWIKAPKGRKVEVKIISFTEGVAVDGCTYAGVEIKTHLDQRLSGHRFCSKVDADTVLKSNLSMVPVITYNRIYATIAKLEYRYV
ncbi:CUB domain-containing protein [Trichostrongylus colubriformis]|uniref:CUB domain-containing protein n=1 Tax=Trichostrongylus colubriformis TaxID=6319 RepID=A0AAN8F049_TRICO